MNIKRDFPALSDQSQGLFIYLDSAATMHKPQSVIDAITHFYAKDYATVGRSMYQRAEKATASVEQVRKKVADFIGAKPEEIIFTYGATDSINFIAQAWAMHHLKKGDNIVVSEQEHHSNLLPWQSVAQKTGADLRFIPIKSDGTLDYDAIDKIITSHTKLVAVSTISNALGIKNDVPTIIKYAHAAGARVLVDATQSVAHEPINVIQMKPDFLVFSGHKMYGPTGVGVLYINQKIQSEVSPYRLGGGMVYEADYMQASYVKAPHTFEAGTPPIAQILGLGAAIDYINAQGLNKIGQHERRLMKELVEGLVAVPKVRILGPQNQIKQEGHVVSFIIEGIHPHDVAAYLDKHGIAVRAGHYCAQPLAKKLGIDGSVRVSVGVYNTSDDIAYFLKILKSLI